MAVQKFRLNIFQMKRREKHKASKSLSYPKIQPQIAFEIFGFFSSEAKLNEKNPESYSKASRYFSSLKILTLI